MGIRYSALPGHTIELSDALNEVLSKKWTQLRGIMVYSLGVNSVTASKEDEEMIKQLQKSAVMRDPGMAAATLVGAQADAMRTAAGNKNGAMSGFMGMGMASQAGGMNLQDLYAMGQRQATANPAAQNPAGGAYGASQGNHAEPASQDGWTCSCGTGGNTGKFCVECGAPKPSQAAGWTCSCGAVNKGKFCSECGAPKPAGIPQYRCDKCGWEPEDATKPPKFCPECGDPFDDGDIMRS